MKGSCLLVALDARRRGLEAALLQVEELVDRAALDTADLSAINSKHSKIKPESLPTVQNIYRER